MVVCDKPLKAETLLDNCEKDQTPVLKIIILMDAFDAALVERGEKCGVQVLSMAEVEVRWSTHTHTHTEPVFVL